MSDNPQFTLRCLAVLAYAHGFTQWFYRHPGALAEVCAERFFCPASDIIMAGDHIHVSAADGGALLWVASASEAHGVVTKRMVST